MVDKLVNSEANARRITLVESCFGSAGQPLSVPGRVLVGEGVLTKMCRKKAKPRQFYLFNDLLVYGNIIINKKKYNKQHIIPLEQVKLKSLEDHGELRNGWLICTSGKSFAVYAATNSEKNDWMVHINKCIKDLLEKGGKKPADEHAAVWVPDSAASACMTCQKSQFSMINRRHHCRKCGSVVCGSCSTRRYLLANVSSKPIRVCDPCYESLNGTSKPEISVNQNDSRVSQDPIAVVETTPRPALSTVLEEGDLDSKSELESTSLFSARDFESGNTLERLPEAPVEVPPLLVPEKNPKMYQLVQMSGESSFWWDSTESDEGSVGAGLSQNFSQFQSRITNDFVNEISDDDSRTNDSSGEDDSDDDEQIGNEEQNDAIPPANFYASASSPDSSEN